MASIDSLKQRMQAELDAGTKSKEQVRQQAAKSAQDRDRKIEQFQKACERLSQVWKPRLELLASKFGEKVKVTPRVSPGLRDATFAFTSDLASVTLKFQASLAEAAGNLVLEYELSIIPILMDYERHARLEVPLGDAAREEAVGPWVDDRIIDFLRTYRAMLENEHYVGKSMVEDPVARVRFPAHAAAFSLKRGDKTYYFINAETKAQFEKSEPAAPAADAKPKPAAGGGAKAAAASVPAAAAPTSSSPSAAPKGGGKPTGASSPSPKSSDRPAPRGDHRS